MRIALGVGEAVVVAVIARPPQRTLLRRGQAAEGEDELRHPRQPEAPVREVTVIAGGDEEHPPRPQHDGENDRGSGDAGEHGEERDELNTDEGRVTTHLLEHAYDVTYRPVGRLVVQT